MFPTIALTVFAGAAAAAAHTMLDTIADALPQIVAALRGER